MAECDSILLRYQRTILLDFIELIATPIYVILSRSLVKGPVNNRTRYDIVRFSFGDFALASSGGVPPMMDHHACKGAAYGESCMRGGKSSIQCVDV